MTSPIKTAETMDLAQALRDGTSSTNLLASALVVLVVFYTIQDEVVLKEGENLKVRLMDQDKAFRALVCTKESSTELIPTHLVESSGAQDIKTPPYVVRDLNAGKGVVDDDGKPVVGKVFSRVIQISGEKSRSSKSRRNKLKEDNSSDSRRHDKDRPQSSCERGKGGCINRNNNSNDLCPSCGRQFSDETMKRHVGFCSN